MIIVLKPGSSDADIEDVSRRVREMGFKTHLSRGDVRTIVGVLGDDRAKEQLLALQSLDCVETVVRILQPFKLASREAHPDATQFKVHGVPIGGTQLVVMTGRGGAYKPRTSPYAFQGLEEEGLKLLSEASKATGLPVVTEVMEPDKVDVVAQHADILQIGARNVQNFSLLKRVAECGKPVLLKRGMSTSIQEWLLSAEYVLAGGNPNVILCERGIRTFETSTRYTLDLNAIPVVKKLSHLPVLVDPSHGTGHWEYVSAMAKAGLAAGADGLIIEVHNNPAEALSDGPQSLKPDRFAKLMAELRPLAQVLGRSL